MNSQQALGASSQGVEAYALATERGSPDAYPLQPGAGGLSGHRVGVGDGARTSGLVPSRATEAGLTAGLNAHAALAKGANPLIEELRYATPYDHPDIAGDFDKEIEIFNRDVRLLFDIREAGKAREKRSPAEVR